MSYLLEQQQEITGLAQQQTALPQQQVQSMHISFDTTGYPIAPLPQNQPVAVSETSKKNSLLVGSVLVGALICSGAIGHHLGASGEAQKAQQQQIELLKARSGIAEFCKQHNSQ
jgi:hypothetical protein